MHHPSPRKKPEQSVKRRCHRCQGSGLMPCPICGGRGEVLKGGDAFGNPMFGRCDGCLGRKHSRCKACGGEGFIT